MGQINRQLNILIRLIFHELFAYGWYRFKKFLKMNYDPYSSRDFSLSALIGLDVDLLTLKLVRIISRGTGNLPTNFGVSMTFYSRLTA